MNRRTFASLVTATILAAATGTSASPVGPVILTVTNAGGQSWAFDRAALEALGWRTITTVTPFTEGPQEFSGVPVSAIVEATGVSGSVFDAVALNDYRAEIPVEHIAGHDIFLAIDHNGEPMRVRDRGPIWIIYPSDEVAAANHRFDSFMVWQLKELHFR